ncbi:MAG: methyltransferase domain-containing protein [Alphaproteobacteria bacterium]|nr:methyltransferase domain-containing protein [Alphaproteobacteria bacterium]
MTAGGRSGAYPLERRSGEVERLDAQGLALAPDADRMLALIGVAPGWRCLDLGCGPDGITGLMSARVGAAGRVVGLDADPAFVALARARAAAAGLANVDYVEGDAYRAALPAASFDLVHFRFVASTAGEPERLIAEAMRLARPGGVVALQDPDMASLVCHPPHPAWDALRGRDGRCVRRRRRRHLARAAELSSPPRSGPRRRPVPAVPGRRARRRSVDRLSARDGRIAPRDRGRTRPDGRGRARRHARRLPRASRPARHRVHVLHGRAGMGPHAGIAASPAPSSPHAPVLAPALVPARPASTFPAEARVGGCHGAILTSRPCTVRICSPSRMRL